MQGYLSATKTVLGPKGIGNEEGSFGQSKRSVLCQDLAYRLSMHIRQPALDAVVVIGQPFVIEAE